MIWLEDLENKEFRGGKYSGKTLEYVFQKDPNYVSWAFEQAPNLIKQIKPKSIPKPKKVEVSDEHEHSEVSDIHYNNWARTVIKPNMEFDLEVSEKEKPKLPITESNSFQKFM